MNYSRTFFHISKADIQHVVHTSSRAGLNMSEERLIEDTILRVRGSNERVSLYQIDQELRQLEKKHAISKYDRKFVMDALEDFVADLER